MSENNENYNGQNFRLVTPKDDNTVKYDLNNKEALLGGSHIAYADIVVNGKKALETVTYKLTLKQNTLDHTVFYIECPCEAFEDYGAYPLEQTRNLIGKKITVQFKQYSTIPFVFSGVIAKVTHLQADRYGNLLLTGYSPTILMENGKTSRSFENLTLEEIIKKVIQQGNYPSNLLETNINPKHKDPIPFIVQYFQTDYQLLQSLAQRYGEWLYYDGNKLVFGGYGGKTVELTEDIDLEWYSIEMNILPQKLSYLCYDAVQAQTVQADTASIQKTEPGNPFQYHAVKTSQDIYGHLAQSIHNRLNAQNTLTELTQEVQREAQARQNLVYAKGRSQSAGIKIGDIVKLKGYDPENKIFKNGEIPLESYIVTRIQHHYEQSEGYYNTFTAIPKEQLIPPYYNSKAYPKAETQRAVVTDNNDPQGIGRVRVRFLWQGENDQSPWLRMLTTRNLPTY